MSSQAIRSSSTMLTCFIIILVLLQQALPTSAEITDVEYSRYAESLREYRYGITNHKKRQLEDKLANLYSMWKNPNDHYGSGITSVTELWIQNIIPEGTPFTVADARYRLKKESPARNEFVWEGLRTLNDFAYVGVDDVHREELEDLRVFATTAEDYLKAQLRWQFLQSDDVSGLLDMSSEVARIFQALESVHRPYVSSFTQVELIKMNWLHWCVDELNIGGKLARLTEMDKDTPQKGKWVEALAFSQLAAGRIALIQSALEKFNSQLQQNDHSSIAVAQLINDMDVLGKAFAYYAEKYRSLTWRHVLGKPTRRFFGKKDSALATAPLQYEHEAAIKADPRKVEGIPDYVISLFLLLPTPENVPPEYLELATRYHRLVVDQAYQLFSTDDEQNKISGDAAILRQKYEIAASAESVDPIDDSIWHKRWKDAKLLRRTYANAVDVRYRSYAESLREKRYSMTPMKCSQLEKELRAFYDKWINSNEPSSITSITGLLVDRIIPKGYPFMEKHVREPTDDMSLAHNEFVWECLLAVAISSYVFVHEFRDEVQGLDELASAYRERLKAQIRRALGGSKDLFSPSDIYVFNMFDVNDKVARVNKALESGAIRRVSSVTQAVLIDSCWSTWCIGNTADFFSRRGRHDYSTDLVKTLPFLQLAAGRMKLMELSLSAFLEQRKQLPQNERSQHEIRKLEETVAFIRRRRIKYQRVIGKRVREWSNKWRGLLGDDVGPHFEKIEFALEESLRTGCAQNIGLPADVMVVLEQLPIPKKVPLAYLKLAAWFNEVKYLMSGKHSSLQLHEIYKEAASVASSSGGAGPSSNPVMNEHIGVNSVAAHDHGSSSSHFQGLSQDTSRTMTEHGQASPRRKRQATSSWLHN
ncbi:hypothetical protein SeLEV6574_g07758 [Synchytrium endobioticum]|uniref:Uncharacterized protein n=1 Tax=Synchytrium endobioticum TaxID=286115 RepID=A0A507CGZ3_9FUNG|nr:hypothetical protein SeLEV6574_g07758 [Synchytrium endobioticum]